MCMCIFFYSVAPGAVDPPRSAVAAWAAGPLACSARLLAPRISACSVASRVYVAVAPLFTTRRYALVHASVACACLCMYLVVHTCRWLQLRYTPCCFAAACSSQPFVGASGRHLALAPAVGASPPAVGASGSASGRGVAASGRGVGEMKKFKRLPRRLRLPELSSAERQSVRYDESVRRRDREEKT